MTGYYEEQYYKTLEEIKKVEEEIRKLEEEIIKIEEEIKKAKPECKVEIDGKIYTMEELAKEVLRIEDEVFNLASEKAKQIMNILRSPKYKRIILDKLKDAISEESFEEAQDFAFDVLKEDILDITDEVVKSLRRILEEKLEESIDSLIKK
jgi:cell division septum initiation protein DivIVA